MSLTAADARRLQALLEGDGVAVLPTDTVYGVACNPNSSAAIARVYELKQRPAAKPAAVMFFSLQAALDALPQLGPRTRDALARLLPGPVTLLMAGRQVGAPPADRHKGTLPADRKLDRPAADPNTGTLGLRVPRLTGALAALRDVSAPALQSSANLSGQPAPRRLADVPAALRDRVDLVLDGGDLPGTASTVVDLSRYEQEGKWRVVREGPLSAAELQRLLAQRKRRDLHAEDGASAQLG